MALNENLALEFNDVDIEEMEVVRVQSSKLCIWTVTVTALSLECRIAE